MPRVSADGINRSQLIRDYRKDHKLAKPREIAAALKAQGVDIDAQYVSVVLSNAKRKKKARRAGKASADAPAAASGGATRRGRKPGRPAGSGAPKIGLAELKLAKQLVDSVGGQAQARAALDSLAELM